MKKRLSLLLCLALCLSLMVACAPAAQPSAPPAPTTPSTPTTPTAPTPPPAKTWKPTKAVEWVVTSSAGGGSDIFSRTLTDIMVKNKIVDGTFVVNNQTDGNGEVGRLRVSQSGNDAHMLMTFNSGDMTPMLDNTDLRVEGFRPIAILAVDKHILFKGKNAKYATLEEAVEAVKGGASLSIGGSKGDDVIMCQRLLESVGLTEDQVPYIMHSSTSEAITSLLGGHIDFCIGKPAASIQYVLSGDMIPIAALANERFEAPLDVAPTLEELGFTNAENPLWRGIVAPPDMPQEAVDYWCAAIKAATETDDWKTGYMEKNLLAPMGIYDKEAAEYMQQYQKDYLKVIGKAS